MRTDVASPQAALQAASPFGRRRGWGALAPLCALLFALGCGSDSETGLGTDTEPRGGLSTESETTESTDGLPTVGPPETDPGTPPGTTPESTSDTTLGPTLGGTSSSSSSSSSSSGDESTTVESSTPGEPLLCILIDGEPRCEERVSIVRGGIVIGGSFQQAGSLRYSGPAATLSATVDSEILLRIRGEEDGPWVLLEQGTFAYSVLSSLGDVESGFDFEVELEAETGDGATSTLTLHFEAEAIPCEETFAETGFRTCDGEWATGCEVNIDTSSEHCGACGNHCGEDLVRGLGLCRDGACEIYCPDGYFGDDCSLARCEGECEEPFICGEVDEVQDCYCPPGTWGEECEESVCDALDCVEGECQLDDRGRARCVCEPGFAGTACDESTVVRATPGDVRYDNQFSYFAYPRDGVPSCTPEYTFELPCPDGWVVTGRRFLRDPITDHIAAMGAICGRIVDPPEGSGGDGFGDDEGTYDPFTHIHAEDLWFGPLVGWTLDNQVEDMRCPENHIVVTITHHSETMPNNEAPDDAQGIDLVEAADWCLPGDLLADPSLRAVGEVNRLPSVSVVNEPVAGSPLIGVDTRRTVLLVASGQQRPGHRGLRIGFDAGAQRWCEIAADAREGVCGPGRSVPRCELDDPL